jgi:hypothetical protein
VPDRHYPLTAISPSSPRCEDNVKLKLKEIGCELKSSGSELAPVAGYRGHGNKPSVAAPPQVVGTKVRG